MEDGIGRERVEHTAHRRLIREGEHPRGDAVYLVPARLACLYAVSAQLSGCACDEDFLDITDETLIQKYDREHPEGYEEVGKQVMKDKVYIAAKNTYAGNGSKADFWMLNALRCIADAALIGGNSMATDSDYVMTVLDSELQHDRIKTGLSEYPLNIIMSLDCTDVPLDHNLLRQTIVPKILITSPKGYEYIRANLKRF